jgi:Flp pilus assembly pilin Flp
MQRRAERADDWRVSRTTPTRDALPSPTSARRLSERAAGLVEYSLLVALIAVTCIVALQFFGASNAGSLDDSAQRIVLATGG